MGKIADPRFPHDVDPGASKYQKAYVSTTENRGQKVMEHCLQRCLMLTNEVLTDTYSVFPNWVFLRFFTSDLSEIDTGVSKVCTGHHPHNIQL